MCQVRHFWHLQIERLVFCERSNFKFFSQETHTTATINSVLRRQVSVIEFYFPLEINQQKADLISSCNGGLPFNGCIYHVHTGHKSSVQHRGFDVPRCKCVCIANVVIYSNLYDSRLTEEKPKDVFVALK
jgi:hypothetical protein